MKKRPYLYYISMVKLSIKFIENPKLLKDIKGCCHNIMEGFFNRRMFEKFEDNQITRYNIN